MYELIFDVKIPLQNEGKSSLSAEKTSWCAKPLGGLQEKWKEGLTSGPAGKITFAAAF